MGTIGIDFDNTIVCYHKLFHRLAVERSLIPVSVAVSKCAVRDYLLEQQRLGGTNFFLCQMIFGDLPHEDALRSLTLFAREVAPALAAHG